MSANSNARKENMKIDRVKKSRMLVALLGADFTKQTDHPFFRHLSETATKESETAAAPSEISQSLRKLLAALESTSPPNSSQRQVETSAPNPIDAPKPHQPKPTLRDRILPSSDEHPAVIAKELREFPRREQSAMIRNLPGPVARQVSLFLWELSKSSEEK